MSAAFAPGESFGDQYVPERVAVPVYFVDGQIREEVFEYGSFRQSCMLAKSVTCSDCHEPYFLELGREGDALCLGCHEAEYRAASHHHHREDGAGVRCVDCHMTARTCMTVDARRDHGFRGPRPDLSVSLGVPHACNGCHADRPAQWAAERVRQWYGPTRAGLQPSTARASSPGVPGNRNVPISGLAVMLPPPPRPRASRETGVSPFPLNRRPKHLTVSGTCGERAAAVSCAAFSTRALAGLHSLPHRGRIRREAAEP